LSYRDSTIRLADAGVPMLYFEMNFIDDKYIIQIALYKLYYTKCIIQNVYYFEDILS